jgi:hypothetical protein
MSLAAEDGVVGEDFAMEDIWTGRHASGFGALGGGRTFSFYVEGQMLAVEIYRPRLAGPVPQAEDVVATSTRRLTHVDVDDERSLSAAVRDAIADAQLVPGLSRSRLTEARPSAH